MFKEIKFTLLFFLSILLMFQCGPGERSRDRGDPLVGETYHYNIGDKIKLIHNQSKYRFECTYEFENDNTCYYFYIKFMSKITKNTFSINNFEVVDENDSSPTTFYDNENNERVGYLVDKDKTIYIGYENSPDEIKSCIESNEYIISIGKQSFFSHY